MAEVTHYSWELRTDPLAREAELLAELGLAHKPSPKDAWIARESS
jgi:hypothetical protein